ncbi:S49 family peptidase [Pseudomonas syringae pv. actinidiae]|nr:S49 family peptidase [Pseudomonas syringae pv. actinidiae]
MQEQVVNDFAVNEAVRQGIKASRYKSVMYGLIGAFFMIAVYAYIFLVGFQSSQDDPHVAVVKVNGPLAEDKPASAMNVISSIREAMENKHSKGLIISINSPGGSPIQAERIYDEIQRQVTAHPDKKIVAVINELCASGGYYVASAAPEIYASRSSLVGSIGVTGSGFGYTGLMEKLGIDRRVYAAGEHKLFLDPFGAKNDEETEIFKRVLGAVHGEFIAKVKDGRGDRLHWQSTPGIFSGLIWAGSEAQEIGLIDKIGTIDSVLLDVYGTSDVVVYEPKKSPLSKISEMIGLTVFHEIKTEIETGGVSVSL